MSDVTIQCLGAGGAFASPVIGHSSFLVSFDGQRILLDCGANILYPPDPGPLRIADLTAIVVSHLHADHVGALEQILYARRFIHKAPPVKLVMGTDTMSSWIACQKRIGTGLNDAAYVELEYADARPPEAILGSRASIQAFTVSHGGDLSGMHCYAFLLTLGGTKIFWSGDRVWEPLHSTPLIEAAMEQAHVILHEIELTENPSGVHSHWSDIPLEVLNDPRIRWYHHNALLGDGALTSPNRFLQDFPWVWNRFNDANNAIAFLHRLCYRGAHLEIEKE